MTKATKERNSDAPDHDPQTPSGRPSDTREAVTSLLYELDAPGFDQTSGAISGTAPANANVGQTSDATLLDAQQPSDAEASDDILLEQQSALEQELVALADVAALPDSDAAALQQSEPASKPLATPRSLSTHTATHVPHSAWFDVTLQGIADSDFDPRQKLAWRFKAATAAYKFLQPLCPTQKDRAELVALLRGYEGSLRAAAGTPPPGTKQVSDALHAQLSNAAAEQLDRALNKVEDKLLSLDECVEDDVFRMRWNKEHEAPKALLRYARMLAVRRFNIGYRRDRFEALAHELLTAKLPSGTLLLMPRGKAGPVLRQLLRGLAQQPSSPDDRNAAIGYLRDALDRLQSLAGAKQFFDSGFFLDVHGYKVSMHDQLLNPEFLYLCVAVNVEIHNHMHAWSQAGNGTQRADGKLSSTPPLSSLRAQLRAQELAVQAVFANFRKPRALSSQSGSAQAPSSKKPAARKRSKAKQAITGRPAISSFVVACVCVVASLGANLFSTGVMQWQTPPSNVPELQLKTLSPLLVRGTLNPQRTAFEGLLSRPAWRRMEPGARRVAATTLAQNLKQMGVNHAHLLAYKTRAIDIEFGSVVYLDETR